jgi:feruloyl esterase
VEIWLPAAGWNGRYYQLGNGGFAGNIQFAPLASELRRGNAAAMTDTGHQGDSFDASWAQGHPERVLDYGYRSVQVTAEVAAALIRAYYHAPARYRYFAGCSNGGRQALIAAQRFPQWWDGILAGAPALDWTRQLATFAWIQHTLRLNPKSWIGVEKLPAIQRAALASCTATAGVVDGVPRDPRACPFDPRTLLCKSTQNDQCLTVEQVRSLQAIQHGPQAAGVKEAVFYGFEPTAAAVADNWTRWIVNDDPDAPSQRTFAEQFYRRLVFGEGEWRLEEFRSPQDFVAAAHTNIAGRPLAQVLDARGTDLTQFQRRGGRLLMYFGWADAVLAPRAGLAYYESVARRQGGLSQTRSFFRLFMVPGMTHCQGGPAPDSFGQSPLSPPLSDDPQHDIRRALERWTERGEPPYSLIAAKGQSSTEHEAPATQLLCPFPQRAQTVTTGNLHSAASYACSTR